jgi:hypothetical protein
LNIRQKSLNLTGPEPYYCLTVKSFFLSVHEVVMPTVEQVLEEIEAKERERKLADSQTTPLLQFMKVQHGHKVHQKENILHTIWPN